MREILFRGKRVVDGKWVESCCPLGEMHSGTVTYDFDSKTVCQYTGLTDKNGRKIFEGDIVQYCDCTAENYVIAWDSDKALFEYRQYGCSIMNFDELSGMEVEVIGNIFDTPELIGDQP